MSELTKVHQMIGKTIVGVDYEWSESANKTFLALLFDDNDLITLMSDCDHGDISTSIEVTSHSWRVMYDED